jgi:hypothetical protein
MKGYYGHVDDIDIALLRGAYQINDIFLNKVDEVSGKQTEFFKSPNIDLSVEWKALLHGSLVGELVFNSSSLYFTKDKIELQDVRKDTNDFRRLLKDFMPLRVNRFEVNDGDIHYIDKSTTPKVDVSLQKTHILALNLTNVEDKKIELPSTIDAEASMYGGTLKYNMKINTLSEKAAFDLNAEVKDVNLVAVNDFFKAYGGFDVNNGKLGLYTEMATKNGKFKGYIKPIIKGLDIVGAEDRHDPFLQKVWESIVSVGGTIFKNQSKDQIATKINMEGNLDNPDISTLDAIWEVLRNAFIQALMPSVENAINLHSLKDQKKEEKKSFFQKLFSSEEKKDDKKG